MYYVKEVGIDELDVQEWNDLLLRSEICDAFQTYEWAQVQRNALNVYPRFLIIRNGKEAIGGVLFFLKKMLRFFDSYEIRGGPLYVRNDEATVMKNVLKAFRTRRGRAVYKLFIPSPSINFRFMEMFRSEGYHLLPIRTLIIDLEKPLEGIWRALGKSTRRMVRRAERFGVTVKIATTWKEWEEYYNLHLLHGRKKAYSTYPYEFFKEMFKLSHGNLSRLFVAKYGEKTVAGELFVVYRKNMVYILGASSSGFLKYNPNNLIQWRSIEWAAENGVTTYDFHGLPEETAYLRGVYRYKKGWDGTVHPFYHYMNSKLAYVGVHLIRRSFSAWKLFTRLRDFGFVQR